jgi:glycosyltransferase involved in cell wall biosynthesis
MSKKIKKNVSKKQPWKADTPKINVLAYSDAPTCATGFSTVSRNIFEGLYRTGRYNIDILGINFWGDPHNFPYRIWPTGTNQDKDPYGRKKICGMIPQMEYDILFFLQDTFILDFLPELTPHLKTQGKKFKSICYFPVDGTPKEQWIKNISVVDYPVAYSEFGKREAQKAYADCPELDIIPHGVNIDDYKVLPMDEVKDFRKRYFGAQSDKFIFTNLNRNQQRKDIPRTIQAFVEFRKHVKDSVLYLHMAQNDQGWNLPEVCKAYGLDTSKDVIFPENFGPNQGYPRQVVNMLYNCSDCIISTTLGEGAGLSWLEAMATKTPVIMPANTALVECITDDKGYLVKSGADPSHHTVLPHDNEIIRPLVDVDDMVKKMLQVHNNYDEAMEKAENAYEWVTNDLNWQGKITDRWVGVFDKVYEDLVKESTEPESDIDEEVKKIETEKF